jgi:hypothetical protein
VVRPQNENRAAIPDEISFGSPAIYPASETRGFPSLPHGRFGIVGKYPVSGLTITLFFDPSSLLHPKVRGNPVPFGPSQEFPSIFIQLIPKEASDYRGLCHMNLGQKDSHW